MLRRLLCMIWGFGSITTFIAIQQTQRYRLQYESVLSNVYRRFSYDVEETEDISLQERTKYLQPVSVDKETLSDTKESLIERYYSELLLSKPFVSQRTARKHTDEQFNRFLLPVLYYNMGPNNLFRIFKESISVAYSMERTLVIPPFHHHPRMKRVQESQKSRKSHDVVNVDIFDQTYTSVIENNPEKVVDMRCLSELMPAVKIDEFRTNCGHKLDTLITCGIVNGKRSLGLDQFKTVMNMSINQLYAVDDFSDIIENKKLKINLLSAMQKTNEDHCIGLALGTRCLGKRKSWFKYWKPFAPFFRPPPEIKILAREFFAAVFHNKPILAVHWRYENEDWQDMCKDSRPESVRRINKPMCDIARQLSSNATALQSLAKRLSSYAKTKNYSYVYVAAPPQLLETLKRLKQSTAGLYIVSDVKNFAERNNLASEIFDNNFSTSFLEQEICFLADMFLGSPLSSWTQTVMLDRTSAGKDKHESVLEVVVKDASNFPKLSWYFPEGT